METTKDKPVIKVLPEDFKKFLFWLYCSSEWSLEPYSGVWFNIETEEEKTTDELYQYYLLGK